MKLLAVLLSSFLILHSSFAAKPNILFIYADDWGFGDLACHGHPHLKTPNLDRLAREGTDFHQFTVCNRHRAISREAWRASALCHARGECRSWHAGLA
jgi:N-acetylgalactosamine-6-sulfatase